MSTYSPTTDRYPPSPKAQLGHEGQLPQSDTPWPIFGRPQYVKDQRATSLLRLERP